MFLCGFLLWKMQSTTDRSEVSYSGDSINVLFHLWSFGGLRPPKVGDIFQSMYRHGQKEQPKYKSAELSAVP